MSQKETQRERQTREWSEKRDHNLVEELAAFIDRRTPETPDTSDIAHVTRALDGSVINVEDLHEVIENLRDELRAVRDAFEEYKKERGP